MQVKGGSKLKRTLQQMSRNVSRADSVKVGFLSGATYPSGVSVALIATIQDFGAPSRGIPPRPFFRHTVAMGQRVWGTVLREALVKQEYDSDRALKTLGEHVVGDIKDTISTFAGAPLAPATIKRKGFDKQLIDTGHMLNSVDYEVE